MLGGLTAWVAGRAADLARPNVLFIAVDDLRDWTGFLGGYEGRVHTPNLDRLAARGVAFQRAYCASPLCNPSRVAVMSGRMPSTTGIYDNSQWWKPGRPDLITIPEHFRAGGYTVAGVGKIFHHTAGSNPPALWDGFHPLRFGDSPWYCESRLNYPWTKYEPPPSAFPFSRVPDLGFEFDWGALPKPEADYDDTGSVEWAAQFLGRIHAQPFFLACGIYRPHLPWYAPQRYFDLYPIEHVRLPPARDDDLDDVPAIGRRLAARQQSVGPKLDAAGARRRAVQAYLACISFADASVGRLIAALDQSPHRANTVIVLWSDHGWHLGEKSHWHKSTLWEVATRVPLVIVAPAVTPPGANCPRPVSLVDIFPTLIDLCGLPPLPTLDERTLLPLLRQPQQARAAPAVMEFERGDAAVRSERYRYIRYRDGTEELYDHADDPVEWTNRASDPALAAIRAELAAALPRQWAEPVPGKNAFEFDPGRFQWKNRETGVVTEGGKPQRHD
jgi:arylsulfatase A-like enzyme